MDLVFRRSVSRVFFLDFSTWLIRYECAKSKAHETHQKWLSALVQHKHTNTLNWLSGSESRTHRKHEAKIKFESKFCTGHVAYECWFRNVFRICCVRKIVCKFALKQKPNKKRRKSHNENKNRAAFTNTEYCIAWNIYLAYTLILFSTEKRKESISTN